MGGERLIGLASPCCLRVCASTVGRDGFAGGVDISTTGQNDRPMAGQMRDGCLAGRRQPHWLSWLTQKEGHSTLGRQVVREQKRRDEGSEECERERTRPMLETAGSQAHLP